MARRAAQRTRSAPADPSTGAAPSAATSRSSGLLRIVWAQPAAPKCATASPHRVGTETVRRFALMVAPASAHHVPNQLLVTALVRARMCQLTAQASDSGAAESAFTVGLFSVADALADAPMQQVVGELPFRADIAAALPAREGPLGAMLTRVIAYEQSGADAGADREADLLAAAYREAIAWVDRSAAALSVRA